MRESSQNRPFLPRESRLQRRAFEVKSNSMAAEQQVVKAPGLVPDEQKFEPRSKGISTARKKKPKELAVITECCTGCAWDAIVMVDIAEVEKEVGPMSY